MYHNTIQKIMMMARSASLTIKHQPPAARSAYSFSSKGLMLTQNHVAASQSPAIPLEDFEKLGKLREQYEYEVAKELLDNEFSEAKQKYHIEVKFDKDTICCRYSADNFKNAYSEQASQEKVAEIRKAAEKASFEKLQLYIIQQYKSEGKDFLQKLEELSQDGSEEGDEKVKSFIISIYGKEKALAWFEKLAEQEAKEQAEIDRASGAAPLRSRL